MGGGLQLPLSIAFGGLILSFLPLSPGPGCKKRKKNLEWAGESILRYREIVADW